MGGKSTSEQTTNSVTNPWEPAQPVMKDIIGKLQPLVANSNLTGNENTALNNLQRSAQEGNQFAPQISDFAGTLMQGGGANDQAGRVTGAYDNLNTQLSPYANGSMIGNNPALKAQLDTIMSDVSNSVNGQFAAAGRDFSGMNQQTLARGVAQGVAPVIAAQYNQDVNNQFNAANALYGAGNNTATTLTGMNQQGLNNRLQGVTTAQSAMDAKNYGDNMTLNLESARRSIPAEALGLLAQIGIPIASLGGTGYSNTQGSQTMSGAQQFATIASGIQNLFPKQPIKFG